MATTDHITTAHQLLDVSLGQPCELVRGHLVMMSPSGFEHGRVVAHITRLLGDFVVRKRLGVLTGAESGFQLARDPDTVRAPDVGFVRKDRVPRTPIPGFFPGAPDLAVEVLSPNDRPRDVQAKVGDWLNAGCRQIWVVDPQART
ncbi:MAG: Uma2 family endonuclease, partial [Pirellulales bacterium]